MSDAKSTKRQDLTREEFDRRLWSKVIKGDPLECWPWTGSRMRSADGKNGGYGMIGCGSRIIKDRNQLYVHRETYKHMVGPIPEGMDVMHSCDNRICCNPNHLSVGTRADNLRDMREKRRHRFGETHHASTVTEEIVREVRRLAAGGMPQKLISQKFGLRPNHVSRIVSRHLWGHLD